MFDIKIGTLVPSKQAVALIPQLNPKGFETYEITFKKNDSVVDLTEYSKNINNVLNGKEISCIGVYDNTLMDETTQNGVKNLIKSAHLFNCNCVGVFAGANPELTVPEQMSKFKEVFSEIAKIAEANNVKVAFENCGEGWKGGSENIAFGAESWELMFNEVPSDYLGLEWEPCHQVVHLVDPLPQLREWAPKVFHVHGKDGTVAWDVLRKYGIRGSHDFAWHRTPGFGDTNWADVFTILLQAGFEGSCDIEGYHDVVHYDDMEWTAQVTSLEYLKRCRGGVEFFPGPKEYRGYQDPRK